MIWGFVFPDDFGYIEDVKGYITTRKGHQSMVDQNGYCYTYLKLNSSKGINAWRCRIIKDQAKCNARAFTVGNKIVRFHGEHSHPPPNTDLFYT